MTRVFWDTNFLVYLFEGGESAARVKQVRSRMLERGDQLVTSALTLGELLVKPREKGDEALRDHETTIRGIATILPLMQPARRAMPRFVPIAPSGRRTRFSSRARRAQASICSSPTTTGCRGSTCRM